VTARAMEHCCLVARPPPAVLRPQSLAFLLPDSAQLYLTAVGQNPASPMRYHLPNMPCFSASKPMREVCSAMPNCRLRHPWDMLILDVLRRSIPRMER
jgi:hypothetical protein